MTITDNGLKLADSEDLTGLVAAGSIGPDSITLGLEPGGVTEALIQSSNIGAGHGLALYCNVDVAFDPDANGDYFELELVSSPIAASLLDAASGITGGKIFQIASVAGTTADTFTLTGHGLALGTPVYCSSIGTLVGAGLAADQVLYVVPVTANTFSLATTLENALAGTVIDITTGGNATFDFIPTVHAASGRIPMFLAGAAPTNQGMLATADASFFLPLRPVSQATGDSKLPDGQTLRQPVGASSQAGLIGDQAQRYYYLYYRCNSTGGLDAGTISVDLVLCPENSLTYYASGFQVI